MEEKSFTWVVYFLGKENPVSTMKKYGLNALKYRDIETAVRVFSTHKIMNEIMEKENVMAIPEFLRVVYHHD